MTHSDTCPTRKKTKKHIEGGKFPTLLENWPQLFAPTNILGGCFPKNPENTKNIQKPIHHSECIDQPACPSPTPELPSSSLPASAPTSARAHARPRPARHFARLRGQRDHGESYQGGPWKSDFEMWIAIFGWKIRQNSHGCGDFECYPEKTVMILSHYKYPVSLLTIQYFMVHVTIVGFDHCPCMISYVPPGKDRWRLQTPLPWVLVYQWLRILFATELGRWTSTFTTSSRVIGFCPAVCPAEPLLKAGWCFHRIHKNGGVEISFLKAKTTLPTSTSFNKKIC